MVVASVQPDAPRIPNTPLELLTLREGEGYTKLDRYGLPVFSGFMGFLIPILPNKIAHRPAWAGIWQHIGMSAVAYFVADFYTKIRMKQRAEDFAVIKHYISLHPEDFPPFERTKIKYMFMTWNKFR